MKQTFRLLALVMLTTHAAFSQQAPLQDFIDKYKQDKAFSYAFLSKDLFDITMKTKTDDATWKGLQDVIRNIGSLTVLAADSIGSGLALYREAVGAIPVNDFDELLAVQDGKDRVKIWVKDDENTVTDLILLVGTAEDFVLVCFSGNLELGNLSSLASLFNPGEAVSLAQASKAVSVDFKIFPNPTAGDFSLEYPDNGDKPAFLSVFDSKGSLLRTLNLSGVETTSMSLPDCPAGMYWFQLKTDAGKVGMVPVQVIEK